jgi:Concanavalin A-like lectin/glucanases superfamily
MKTNYSTQNSYLHFVLLILIVSFFIPSCKKENTNNPQGASSENISNDTAIITNGLVAWYTFDNGSLQDKSGHGNNIIFSNATSVADRDGTPNGAYSFNGTSNYMQVANSPTLQLTNKMTLYAVIKVNGFYAGQCHGNRILQKGYDDNTSGHYSLGFDDDYFYNNTNCWNIVDPQHENFNVRVSNSLADLTGFDSDYIKTGKWYTFAFTYNGSVAKIYMNGMLKTSNSKSTILNPNSDDLFIGMSNINDAIFPYWFNGVIDEIRIYRRALSATEIKVLSAVQ